MRGGDVNKKVLIIGGSYFAGRVLVEHLLQDRGWSIHVVNRGNRPLMLRDVNEIVCDRSDSDRLRALLPPLTWDAVVDFCAYTPEQVESLLQSLPGGSCKQYILISTASIYANTHTFPIREDAPKVSAPQLELGQYANYGYDKWKTEQKLMELAAAAGMAYTCLRPAIIYGEYNYARRESYFFDLIRWGETVFLPDKDLALFQFVSVGDVARIIRMCIGNENTVNAAYNLAAEELICYRRLIEVLEKITGKRIVTKTVSVETINHMAIPLPFPLDCHWIYSGRLIEEKLDFEYTAFMIGMQRAYEWYMTCVSDDQNRGR